MTEHERYELRRRIDAVKRARLRQVQRRRTLYHEADVARWDRARTRLALPMLEPDWRRG